jgi:hypothetical protein
MEFIWLVLILAGIGLVFGGFKGARIGAGIGIVLDGLVLIWAFMRA